MIQFINVGREELVTILSQKAIVCFGAGMRLRCFIDHYPMLSIGGIIDNYKSENSLDIGGQSVPVWLPEEALCQIGGDVAIVVTSLKIEEIVEQMDAMEQFNDVLCCAEVALDQYSGIDEDRKYELEKVIDKLSHRTHESILREHFGEANLTSDRKRFQIWEYFGVGNTAGSKAREDIRQILGHMGYQVVNVHCGSSGDLGTNWDKNANRLATTDWLYFLNMLPEHSIVFLQFPMPKEAKYPGDILRRIKEKKGVCFASVIHDIDILRKTDSFGSKENFQLIREVSDFLIVHNDVMRQYLTELGVERKRLINLQIFDYVYDGDVKDKVFEKSIVIAGNLDMKKSAYLAQLGRISQLKVYLYGPNFSTDIFSKSDNVVYCGSVPSEQLPQKLDRGFGLIWDGSSIDTCAGGTGEYLRYNNPHKMSLYLSSGLPVIIWSGAAQAEFVREKHVGIAVDSLYEISNILEEMSEDEYRILAENAKQLSGLLRSGEYTRSAVRKVEDQYERYSSCYM